jgi:hypothetical protein
MLIKSKQIESIKRVDNGRGILGPKSSHLSLQKIGLPQPRNDQQASTVTLLPPATR